MAPRIPSPPGRTERALTSDSAVMALIAFTCTWQFAAALNSIGDFVFVGPAHAFDFLNPSIWSALPWIIIAIVCAVSAIVKPIQPAAIALAVGINTLWGISYIGGWLTGVAHDSWIFSLGYIATAAFILMTVARGKAEHGVPGGEINDT